MKSRFMKEITGELGSFWKAHAEKELDEVRNMFNDQAYVVDGVVRWRSNDNVVMDDMAEKMAIAGCNFDRRATEEMRAIEDAKFIESYKMQQAKRNPSIEELYELEAAFGRGTTVVDVITGRRINL